MSNMQQALKKILDWFKHKTPKYYATFQPGLTQKEIEEETKDLPFELPREVYQLYQWKNGSPLESTSLFNNYFLPGHLFLPLQTSKKEYYQNIDIFDEDWQKDWFPIFSLEGYSYFIICQEQSINSSPVWYFDYEQMPVYLCYDSLTTMMLTISKCYETGAYYLDEKGLLKENKRQVAQIRRKHNPIVDKSLLNELRPEITLASLTEISYYLIEFKPPKAVEPLIQILQSSTKSVSCEEQEGIKALAARILGEIGDSRAVLPLIEVLLDEEYLARYWAIISIGRLKDSRATPHLINLLEDSHQQIRKLAIRTLGEIKDIRAIEPLIELSKSKDNEICQVAQDALLKFN